MNWGVGTRGGFKAKKYSLGKNCACGTVHETDWNQIGKLCFLRVVPAKKFKSDRLKLFGFVYLKTAMDPPNLVR